MKTLSQFLSESVKQVRWVMPSDEDLKLEWKLEYENKNLGRLIGRDVWPTAEDFLKAAKSAEHKVITPQIDKKIAYRSHTSSQDELISLLKSYRSWGKFRNEKLVQGMYDAMRNGSTMKMPIVLDIDGKLRVFGGNTRMDIAFQVGINPKVLMIKVPKKG